MIRHDETTSEIRKALERETERRFDGERLGHALASRRSATALRADRDRRHSRVGPFGRLPAAVQWVGLAAALLGAALGIRSFYLERTRAEWAPPPQAGTNAAQGIPPGAGAATSNPSAAPAPTLHEPIVEPMPPEKRPRRKSSEKPDDWIAGTSASPEPLGALDSDAEPASRPNDSAVVGVGLVQRPNTATATGVVGTGSPELSESAAAALPRVVAGLVRAADPGKGGVRVLSVRAGGRTVRPEIREAPEVGATLVIVPAVAAFSSLRDLPFRERRGVPSIEPAAFFASSEPNGRVFGTKDESIPSDDPGIDPENPSGGAYYVRLFLGSGFEPAVPRWQGLMGDGLQVIPLRENEVWGDAEQEDYLAKNFRLTSIAAVDGARVEPDEDDHVAESNFVAGVGGQVLGVSLQASPGETEGMHRIELRLHRAAGGRPGDPPEGAVILAATLLVENGRIVVLGIPEPDDAVQARRGPRVAFIALSPRFGAFEPVYAAEVVHTVEGDVEPPVLVEKTRPVYSQEALEQRAEGRVVLRAVIRKDGQVDGIQVLRVPQVPGGEYLMEAAARAVREWRYLPAQLHGEPVNVYFTAVVNFTLSRGNGT